MLHIKTAIPPKPVSSRWCVCVRVHAHACACVCACVSCMRMCVYYRRCVRYVVACMRFYVSLLWVVVTLGCVHVLFVHSVLLVIFGVRLYALTPLRIVSLFKNVLTMPISFCIMRLSNMNWQRDSGRHWEHKMSVGG